MLKERNKEIRIAIEGKKMTVIYVNDALHLHSFITWPV